MIKLFTEYTDELAEFLGNEGDAILVNYDTLVQYLTALYHQYHVEFERYAKQDLALALTEYNPIFQDIADMLVKARKENFEYDYGVNFWKVETMSMASSNIIINRISIS